MNKRVVMKVKVADNLRHHFQAAAWRTNQTPSYLLRKMMMGYVWLANEPKSIDLTVVSNSYKYAEGMDGPDEQPEHPAA